MWERSFGRVVAAVVAVLILSAATPGIGAVAPTGTSPPQIDVGPSFQQGVDTDSVRLIVSVDRNGSASWTVQYWTRLDDENTTAAFESLQADIREDPDNFSDRFASRMRSTVATAENSTGREMDASDFRVSAETRTPPEYGVVTYTFRWDGFAAVDGDSLRVGDAIEGSSSTSGRDSSSSGPRTTPPRRSLPNRTSAAPKPSCGAAPRRASSPESRPSSSNQRRRSPRPVQAPTDPVTTVPGPPPPRRRGPAVRSRARSRTTVRPLRPGRVALS
ncbi:hypothetical protein ACFQL0_02580 [Haloplanus litoreus]|uniref:DUF7345 domain-containing protein n=1 Tax=Haloplanus litoreus TaxID=767515 RepID=UPI00360C0FA4